MGRKLRNGRSRLLRLHRGQRRTNSRTRPAGRLSCEPDFRGPRRHRSDYCRVGGPLKRREDAHALQKLSRNRANVLLHFARSALGVRCVLASLLSLNSSLATSAYAPNHKVRHRLLSREPAEQKNTQHDKQNIREPDKQFRMRMRVPAQRVADDYEQEVSRGNNQPHGKAN
jgi:uncharacterized membrane-anchored protein YhcB (DUF1043 family)